MLPVNVEKIASDLDLWSRLFRIIVIAGSSLGAVYVFGRLLGILKTDRAKNIFAVICLLGSSYMITEIYWKTSNRRLDLWESLMYALFAAIIYVSFLWDWRNTAKRIRNKIFKNGKKKGKITRSIKVVKCAKEDTQLLMKYFSVEEIDKDV